LRNHLLIVLTFSAVGCSSESPSDDEYSGPAPAAIGSSFSASRCGRVEGRVTWLGDIPEPPAFLYCVPRPGGEGMTYLKAENPNRPRIDPKSKAVEGAVVYLRGIDPARSRHWDHPAVRVEVGQGQIAVLQGHRRGRVGFVQHGESFTARATENQLHILRGRGDDYFSLALPEIDRDITRVMPDKGRVELSSGTGQYWMRADLFVTDHPYFTTTDADGRFAFDQVPDGPVEAVVWLPSWEVASQERNPDTTAISTMTYRPAIERGRGLAVEAGKVSAAEFALP